MKDIKETYIGLIIISRDKKTIQVFVSDTFLVWAPRPLGIQLCQSQRKGAPSSAFLEEKLLIPVRDVAGEVGDVQEHTRRREKK